MNSNLFCWTLIVSGVFCAVFTVSGALTAFVSLAAIGIILLFLQ
jgi:hypothetical protein